MTSRDSKIQAIIGPQPKKIWLALSTLGLLVLVIATIMPIIIVMRHESSFPFFRIPDTYKYIYAAGALIVLTGRLFAPYKGNNVRIKRLFRIETWSAVFFCVAAFFAFYDESMTRNWLAFTLAGGAIQCYTSIMIPRTFKKAVKALDSHPE